MSVKYQIDDIDRKILSHLVKNARIPFLEIAGNAAYPEPPSTNAWKRWKIPVLSKVPVLSWNPTRLVLEYALLSGLSLTTLTPTRLSWKRLKASRKLSECHFITAALPSWLIKMQRSPALDGYSDQTRYKTSPVSLKSKHSSLWIILAEKQIALPHRTSSFS